MNSSFENHSGRNVPEIVHIVLSEAEKQRRSGGISAELFERQLSRLMKEELEPRHLTLLRRVLADGRTRFLIKHAQSGEVCEMFESAPLASAA
jgi:hypothetical protein